MNLDLAIIVIGKNEAKNIINCAISISGLKEALNSELLYIDSASSDDSVNIAKNHFDKVLILEKHYHLNASAGRYVGVNNSNSSWLLFLDADMELAAEFLNRIIQHVKNQNQNQKFGLVGDYLHCFDNGKKLKMIFSNKNGVANYFGGAVLLPREAFIKNNWNCNLYSNEEIDLYTRMQADGFKVKYLPEMFVSHHTEYLPFSKKLTGIFIKDVFLGKKYYGFGQLIHSRLVTRNFFNLLKFYPEPFIYLSLVLISVLFLLCGHIKWTFLTAILALLYITMVKGFRFCVVYLAYIPQIIFGFNKYDESWKPSISKILSK